MTVPREQERVGEHAVGEIVPTIMKDYNFGIQELGKSQERIDLIMNEMTEATKIQHRENELPPRMLIEQFFQLKAKGFLMKAILTPGTRTTENSDDQVLLVSFP